LKECLRQETDVKAHHALLCRGSGDRSIRHNAVRDLLLELTREALESPKLEPKGLMDNKSRPADILLNKLERRRVVVDVTVYTPFSIQIQPLAATTRLVAAAEGEQSKHSKYLLLEGQNWWPLQRNPQELLAVRH
jgi:hypothetical protein